MEFNVFYSCLFIPITLLVTSVFFFSSSWSVLIVLRVSCCDCKVYILSVSCYIYLVVQFILLLFYCILLVSIPSVKPVHTILQVGLCAVKCLRTIGLERQNRSSHIKQHNHPSFWPRLLHYYLITTLDEQDS